MAKQVSVLRIAKLGLVPNATILGIAHVSAAVVALLALDLRVTEFQMENGVPNLPIQQQHIVPPIAVADQQLLLSIDVPLVASQFARRRHWHPIPALEIGGRQNIHPSLRVGLQRALALRHISASHLPCQKADACQDGE